MASLGSMKSIFEDPNPESCSTWAPLLPEPSSASYEVFGKLFHPSSTTTSIAPPIVEHAHPPIPRSRSIDALSEADDAAAFEIFGELCYRVKDEDGLPVASPAKEERKNGFFGRKSSSESSLVDKERTSEVRRSYFDARQRVAGGGRGGTAFPPPITTIGCGGKPRVTLKSWREDGRFVLREVRVPMRRQLQATRENGRLTMRVMRQENEEEKKEKREGGEEEEGEDFRNNSEKVPTD